jgi:hypothetical protein
LQQVANFSPALTAGRKTAKGVFLPGMNPGKRRNLIVRKVASLPSEHPYKRKVFTERARENRFLQKGVLS